jgi:hypothetical protein
MEKKFYDDGIRSSMTPARIQRLEALDFQWAKRKGEHCFEMRYAQLKEFYDKHGHCQVPTKNSGNPALGRFVSTQRSQYKLFQQGKPSQMTLERVRRLKELKFSWDASESSSKIKLLQATPSLPGFEAKTLRSAQSRRDE